MYRQYFEGLIRRWFTGRRELIVNADDFGMSPSVNRGVIGAHERGIVTSASLMVRRPAAQAAAWYGRTHPALSVGLHVDLGEWIYRNDRWEPLYIVTDLQNREAVAAEVERQLEIFLLLVGAPPTHVDSHQHVHREEPIRTVLADLAARLDVPLRHYSREVGYCGQFYAQEKYGVSADNAITVDALTALIASLPRGTTELCCHPGDAVQPGEQYGESRVIELQTLCDDRVRKALFERGITLRSFTDLRQPRAADVSAGRVLAKRPSAADPAP